MAWRRLGGIMPISYVFREFFIGSNATLIYSLRASGPSISDAINSTWFDNMLQYTMDTRVFVYLVVVSIGPGVLFGLAPALRLSKLDIASALKIFGDAHVPIHAVARS